MASLKLWLRLEKQWNVVGQITDKEFLLFKRYLFIWLCFLTFVEATGIFSCGMWGLVP